MVFFPLLEMCLFQQYNTTNNMQYPQVPTGVTQVENNGTTDLRVRDKTFNILVACFLKPTYWSSDHQCLREALGALGERGMVCPVVHASLHQRRVWDGFNGWVHVETSVPGNGIHKHYPVLPSKGGRWLTREGIEEGLSRGEGGWGFYKLVETAF